MTDRRQCLTALAAAGAALALPGRAAAQTTTTRSPDVVFVPTPQEIVDEMLSVASVGPNDVLFDLGSGDGRIPITAAKRWGTRGTGVDIDPQRIQEANANAQAAGVTDKVRFIQADLFEMDLSPATVITLYLLPDLNLKLRPTILKLKPGTRIVSHDFSMGDWKPERTIRKGYKTVYFWTVPPAGKPYPRGTAG
ncbi:MAG TPA: class I SAM-dependent methyltransferase [Burkholderiaceae bacterium]|nr:class I SAM-dependent methyltransferase [Burkholderiaceae bacterium]